MAVAQNLGRTVSRNAPEIGGGIVGVGVPVLLRETVDVRDGQAFSLAGDPGSMLAKLTRPSVAYGVGAGGLTGALYLAGIGPKMLHDFYLTHSITGVATGIGSALVPKEAAPGGGGSGATARARTLTESTKTGGSGNGEFSPSGGRSAETTPAN